jgi:hypothetical protein
VIADHLHEVEHLGRAREQAGQCDDVCRRMRRGINQYHLTGDVKTRGFFQGRKFYRHDARRHDCRRRFNAAD